MARFGGRLHRFNEDQGDKINLTQYLDSAAGRLLQVGRGDVAYWAFVPHPLPPQLALTNDLLRVLYDSSYSLGELAALGRELENPHLLIGSFVRREAVLSSRIEGTRTNITDLYLYEAGQLAIPGLEPAPPEADAREVANYVQAITYGIERLNTLPISLRLLREMHERLMRGVRGEHATPGEFRRSQNWIGRPGCSANEAEFVPPPVPEMMEALDALEKYLHAEDPNYPALVRLAFIHYQFEAVHPFLDGNGRIGRLLVTLLLVAWSLLPSPLLYLSAFFEKNRQAYYDNLLAVSQRGAWTEWVIFFLRGVAEQARDAAARARLLQDLRATWRNRLLRARHSPLALKLADTLFARPVVTIPIVQKDLEVTYRSAQYAVERLVRESILMQVGEASYGKTYVAKDILAIVSDTEESGDGIQESES